MRTSSLNHTYRLVWSHVFNAWVAVAEHVKGKGKSKSLKPAAVVSGVLFAGLSGFVLADVTGGVVTSGSGTIVQSGQVTTINQQSQTLNLNWQTFNINQGQTVNFVQPSSTALAVNQILDTNGSRILGSLNANGIVWLINPNGVFFGQGAQVNVGSILASTLNPLSTTDASEQVFGNGGKGKIVNKGNIQAADGGYVAFIGNSVSNQGTIVANNGTVALAGGSQVTLSFADNSLYKINVDQSTLNNLAENKELIQADGGAVFLSAGAKQSLLASVVNNEGIIEAQTIEDQEGKIVLLAGMAAGTTKVSGTLDASAETGDGGFIETSGAKVKVTDGAKITTRSEQGTSGTWLIDPLDFYITYGSAAQTSSGIGATTLSNSLNNGNVTIATENTTGTDNGDIFVNGAVKWSANNTLTLSAYRNIYINESITATGASGKLALEYGQGDSNGMVNGTEATYNIYAKVNLKKGLNFSTLLGSNGEITVYQVITDLGDVGSTTATDLQGINGNLSGNYVLGADIDASATATWNADGNGGYYGFSALGDGVVTYSPTYSVNTFTGTFDGLGHVIKNLTINRTDNNNVGLFGYTGVSALIQNVGLVDANITGSINVGGLVGTNLGQVNTSFVTGQVKGGFTVGGLVGANGGVIQNTYFTGEVSAIDDVGGLVGWNALMNSSETVYEGLIEDSYADSSITMLEYSSGGYAEMPNKGGLVGLNSINFGYPDPGVGTVNNSFWNTDTEATDNGVGTGVTATELHNLSTFINTMTEGLIQTLATDTTSWDISSDSSASTVWMLNSGQAPLLRAFLPDNGLSVITNTPQVITDTVTNIQQKPDNTPPPNNNPPPVLIFNDGAEQITELSDGNDDRYDVIQTYGCGV